jgi:hypothetical protein
VEVEDGAMEELLLTLLVMCLVAGGVALVVVWRVVRWVRRSTGLRRRVRSVQALTTPPGARRQVACLRRDLSAAAHATGEAVALVRAAGGAVGELPRVLPAARARVVDVTRVALTIRRAASAGLGAETAAEIAPLQAQVEREVLALDAGVDRLLALAAGA